MLPAGKTPVIGMVFAVAAFLGNVVHRLRFRAVTDFLDFYVGSAHSPAFNMADVFVVGGVG